jgi:hypothetical protein|tara:strand:- start:17 stop:241 length:225 start_codon:yes stop_codon:yes gene_type:complete
MGSLFSPKMPPLPPVQPLPEPPKSEMSAEDKERIAAEQAAIERRRRGRKSTILTGTGLSDIADENVEKKTLLGA